MTKSKIEFQPLQIGNDDFHDNIDEFIDEFDTQLEEDSDNEKEWNESKMELNIENASHYHHRYICKGFITVAMIVLCTILVFYILPTITTMNKTTTVPTNNNNDDSMQQTKPSPKYSVQLSDGKMYELVNIQNMYNQKNNNKNNNKDTEQNVQDLKMYHDKKRFTQGLTYSKHSNTLYESFGLYGKSGLCKLDPVTGNSTKCVTMDSKYFAEGMQVYTDQHGKELLIQITWKEQTGFIYDANTLAQLESFEFTTVKNEGWGICLDEENREFIVSDGSEYLHFWDVDSLKEKRRVKVERMSGVPAYKMNELEFVHGKVLANVWYEDVILVIDPVTGACESEYDLSMLWPQAERMLARADVLNGISVSNDDGILYITGKKWDRMYTMKLKGFS